MKFDAPSFTKASKRYAERHSLPVIEAQQSFCEFFGFHGPHDAFKRMEADETPGSDFPAPANAFWCDLTLSEFKLLFEVLFSGTADRGNVHSDQARLLSRALLDLIEAEGMAPMRTMLGVSEPETVATVRTIELLSCMDMNAMDATYFRLRERQKTDRMIEWPRLERSFARYIQSLPEYDTRRSVKKDGQSPETRSHHLYSVAELSRVFDLLIVIEDAGGAAACVQDKESIHDHVQTMILERHPAKSMYGEKIIKTAKLVELYPSTPMTLPLLD